jgi:hypothetical protein
MARRSIRKLSLRSANPRGAKLSAASKRLVKEALEERVANKGKAKGKGKGAKKGAKAKGKKKGGLKKGSAAAKAWGKKMAAARRRKAKGEGKVTPKKGKKKGSKAGKKAGKKSTSKKGSSKSARAKKMKGTFSGSLSLRAANRGRRAAAARRSNPGFNVKRALIESGVLLVGTFAAGYIMPHASKFLEGTLGLSGSTLGYAKIVGAALTVVGGHYLDAQFGEKLGFDVQPVTYALATFMAHDGFINAGLVADPKTKEGMGAVMLLNRPMNGYMGYADSDYLPANPPSNSMTGYMGYADSDYLPANPPSNSMTGMGATLGFGGDSGSIFDHSSHMNGSIFTASELPFPPVGPHNVMQGGMHGDFRNATFGQQVVKPELC